MRTTAASIGIDVDEIRVTMNQAKRIGKQALRNRRGVWMISGPGCGKTTIVKQMVREIEKEDGIDIRVILRNPAFENPVDTKGICPPVDDPNDIDFYPIGDMKLIFDDGTPPVADMIVFFLDDFGNATDVVKSAYMPFLCDTGEDRWVGGRKIRDNVIFVVASNRKKDKSGVRGMLQSVTDRSPCILNVYPDRDEWIDWAIRHGMPMSVVSWIRWNGENLLVEKPSNDFEKNLNPRNIQYLGEIVRDWKLIEDDKLPAYAGAVGDTGAVDYQAWEEIYSDPNFPTIEEIFQTPAEARIPEANPGAMWAVAGMLAENAHLDNFDAVLTYVRRFTDQEFAVFAVLSAIKVSEELTSTSSYLDWQRDNAHLYRDVN
jgi:hypothetical protein